MKFSTGIARLDFILGAFPVLFILVLVTRKSRVPKGLRLPPGPPGKLIIGNLKDLPTEGKRFWETFDGWAKKYGDLVYLNVLGQPMISVNSPEVAHDLFDKKSSIYSDRLHSPMLHDLIEWDWNIAFMPYGDWWRRHRRTMHQYFNPSAVGKYHDVQTRQSRVFLQRLHDSPTDFAEHIRHLSGAVILEVVYGIKVLPKADPYIEVAEAATRRIAESLAPGKYLIEFLPLLKYVPAWMPGAEFRQVAYKAREGVIGMREMPFAAAKNAFDSGTAKPSIAASLLEDLLHQSDAPPDQDAIIRNVTGMAYNAGADTTVSTLTCFMLAMVLYPEAQRKAQAELDSVLGNRLPVFEDLKNLPYVNAVCKEALRWHPAFPLGTPHRLMEDDVYKGYFIPKGTIVMGNAWTILHDEKIYGPDCKDFKPERFLRSGAPDPIGPFGFGRRVCPGRYMAENSIGITVASVLKVFDISLAKDDEGNDIPVEAAFDSRLLSHPEPFRCTIKPRSEQAQSLLMNTLAD